MLRRRGFVWYRTEPGEIARSVRVFKNARDHAFHNTWMLLVPGESSKTLFFSEGKQQKQYSPENVVVAAIIASVLVFYDLDQPHQDNAVSVGDHVENETGIYKSTTTDTSTQTQAR